MTNFDGVSRRLAEERATADATLGDCGLPERQRVSWRPCLREGRDGGAALSRQLYRTTVQGGGSRLPTLARGRRSLTDSGGGGTSSGHRLGPVQAFIPHAGRLRDESAIGRARRHGLSVTFRSDVPHGPIHRAGVPYMRSVESTRRGGRRLPKVEGRAGA
jgi:hypothetical protein